MKTDNGYPRYAGVFSHARWQFWQTLGVSSTLTPIGQLHQSLPSPVQRSGGPIKMSQSPVSRNSNIDSIRKTYGQAQGRSGGHQGSSVNRRCQLSVVGRLWHLQSPPKSLSLRRVSIQKPASRISQLSRRENVNIFPDTNL